MASSRAILVTLAVLGLASAVAAAGRERSLLQACNGAVSVKIADLVAKKKAPCVAQVIKGAVVTPKDAKDTKTADAVCAKLGFGAAVPGSIKWTSKAESCTDGKDMKTAIRFASLSCCPAAAATARVRETAAENGGSISTTTFGH